MHLATHGYFIRPEVTGEVQQGDRRADLLPGMLSGLVCAGANEMSTDGVGDGYLTADEVAWLDLSVCDLVVLSACDTGVGRAESGEGLLGLRRAFLLAGADTVASSLWNLPDQETAELMDRFYENLWDRGLGTHQALRAAQLAMIEQGYGPGQWGAFVVDGDWR